MQKVLVIVGPTASGKSALAVQLAKKFKGEVISADSRQVYKGLDIGTGKITKREMQSIPHYLLDIADPKQQVTASSYAHLAQFSIEQIEERGRLPILVGGTGFYIDAVTGAASLPDVPPNAALRKKLNKLSTAELFKILKRKDSKRARTIDPHNKIRLIRALEIIEALGKVPMLKNNKPSNKYIFIGLKPEKEDLEKKIYKRLIERIPGIIREARKLPRKRAYELGLEYKFAVMYLDKKLDKKEFVEKLNIAIRQYAKRQMTWFKRNKNIRWFKPNESKKIENYVRMSLVRAIR